MFWHRLALVPAASAMISSLAGFTDLAAIRPQLARVNDGCDLPPGFKIQDFTGKTHDTGSTLSSFDFTFNDPTTEVKTLCQFNSSSESTTPGGLQKRYACNDGEVKFIWDNEDDQLLMVERICPAASGTPQYETAGSILMHLKCDQGTQLCVTNATEVSADFTSISPVRDPTL